MEKTQDPVQFPPEWEPINGEITKLLSSKNPNQLKIISDLFRSGYKFVKEDYGTLSLKIVSTVIRELRYSFKIFEPYWKVPKITIFGSARVPSGAPLYELAKEFAAKAVSRKFMIITGGGPGIMAGGNEGAQNEGFGLNIRLPFEQSANPFIDADKKLLNYKYFFTRKLFLVKEASAFAFFPGGFGTFDEAFEVLTLVQTGKSTLIPIVMVETEGFGYWTELIQFLEEKLMKKGFISESDKSLYHVFHSADEALDHIEQFYKNYHSMRLVKEKLVIRLKNKLSPRDIEDINKKFSKLSGGEAFVQTTALEEESNESEFNHLPRLVFPFQKRDFGTLRQLIDRINLSN